MHLHADITPETSLRFTSLSWHLAATKHLAYSRRRVWHRQFRYGILGLACIGVFNICRSNNTRPACFATYIVATTCAQRVLHHLHMATMLVTAPINPFWVTWLFVRIFTCALAIMPLQPFTLCVGTNHEQCVHLTLVRVSMRQSSKLPVIASRVTFLTCATRMYSAQSYTLGYSPLC